VERVVVALFGGPRATGPSYVADRFETARSALMLARLALAPNKRLTRDALAESLWPDDYLDASRTRVRKELARLRSALGPLEEVLLADRQTIALDPARVEVDLDTFRALVRAAALASTPSEAAERIGRARALAAPPLLPGMSDDWAAAVREEVEALRARAATEHARALLSCARAEEACAAATEAVTLDPVSESASATLARSLEALGRAEELEGERRRFARARERAGMSVPDATAEPAPAPRAAPVSLIGREFELGYVTDLLSPANESPCRLVTLVGPAGAGKTRLAQEVARVLEPLFAGGVRYLRLEELTQASEVEIPSSGPRPELLVLDNGEQLLPGFADVVHAELERSPRRILLVTSVVPLGLSDETVVRLFPLPAPRVDGPVADPLAFPAVRLFMDLARRAGHPLEPDPGTLENVARVVGALEGWPLAIVLAAGRAGVLSPAELVERLDELPDLLRSRRHDLPERHRSLDAAIGWTLRLLSDSERAGLGRLARLPMPFDLAAAEGALGPGALDSVERYVELGAVERRVSAGRAAFVLPGPVRRFVLAWDAVGTIAS